MGLRTAPVVAIEYADFECPFCVKFAVETLPSVVESYVAGGKLLFLFRHLPLERRHPTAVKAAKAAECAAQQGKFWAMHDLLFRDIREITVPDRAGLAGRVGLDLPRFAQCLEGPSAGSLEGDMTQARALSINGTPTFLFGKRLANGQVAIIERQSGAIPFTVFASVIDRLLGESAALPR